MSDRTITYYGKWWIPSNGDDSSQEYQGVLFYNGQENSILVLYDYQFDIHCNQKIDVIFGKTIDGVDISLFSAVEVQCSSSGKTHFAVSFILVGEYLNSLDVPQYDLCTVNYPYLREWTFHQWMKTKTDSSSGELFGFEIDAGKELFEYPIEQDIMLVLSSCISNNFTKYRFSSEQETTLSFKASSSHSINTYLKLIFEFSSFLSLALFSTQNPSAIRFQNSRKKDIPLLFKIDSSKKPDGSIIKFSELHERLPVYLEKWHKNYIKLAPIVNHLSNSISGKNTFGSTDFLLIIQAIEGYHKRFRNKINGKDNQQLKDEINLMLKHFNKVEVLNKLHINSDLITDTRNFYTHLFIHDEKPNAVTDFQDLYWLTIKCKVLLVCCIFDYLGMDTEVINLCCSASPIEREIREIPDDAY